MEAEALYHAAEAARKFSYCPYSGFAVGAALLTKSGKVYTGVNVENASYPAGICAERTAVSKAVADGEREFSAIAIAGGRKDLRNEAVSCAPCGICRQVLSEFSGDDFSVIIKSENGEGIETYLLKDLLPFAFKKEDMQ